ncbi:MAG: hypothetical protein LBU82_01955, partial [Treponema sp.]|nr:hypothetical protein [Treponema sp.]
CPLNRDALLKIGASAGSDVPFFISGAAAAWVSGRGELIKPLEAPRCFFVLVNPGIISDTSEAYRLLDLERSGKSEPVQEIAGKKEDCEDNHEFYSIPPQRWPFFNDFLPILRNLEHSLYSKIISQLTEQGAGFTGLSGTGSTCFGVFLEKENAEKATEALLKTWYFVKIALPACKNAFIESFFS